MSFVLPGGPIASVVADADYLGLRQSIAKWLNRTDLSEQIPDFVRLAEQEHRRDVRAQAMEAVAVGTLASGILSYPEDFLEARNLMVEGCQYQYATLRTFRSLQHHGIHRRVFTHVGQTIEVLGGGDGQYVLDYYAEFPHLTADTDSNWLLQNAYDVYLWKCCEKGAVWLKDAEGALAFRQLYDAALARLNDQEYTKRYSGSEPVMAAPGVV